jgi:hypothetical protein
MHRYSSTYSELILLDKWTLEKLDALLHKFSKIGDIGRRIDSLSRHFLGTPYQESTLIGDMKTPEVLVINLEGVDCFTFLDYIESMRSSSSFHEFKENVKKVRYQKGGTVSFEKRNHFFTDWHEFNATRIDDVTEEIGGRKVIRVKKLFNKKEDGTYFLPGIQPKEHFIHYIPVNAIGDVMIKRLKTGDYIGIYATEKGLDVSHVGIIIKEGNKIHLRHASSLRRKVIDEDFKNYILDKPGIIILRPKPLSIVSKIRDASRSLP